MALEYCQKNDGMSRAFSTWELLKTYVFCNRGHRMKMDINGHAVCRMLKSIASIRKMYQMHKENVSLFQNVCSMLKQIRWL